MDNEKANTLIDIFTEFRGMIDRCEIGDYKLEWDEKSGILDIIMTPIISTKFVKVDFTITSDGTIIK